MRPASGRLARARRLGTACRSTVVGGGAAVEAFEVAVAAPRTEARGNLAAGRSIHGRPGRILAARLRRGVSGLERRLRLPTADAKAREQCPRPPASTPRLQKFKGLVRGKAKYTTRPITAAATGAELQPTEPLGRSHSAYLLARRPQNPAKSGAAAVLGAILAARPRSERAP